MRKFCAYIVTLKVPTLLNKQQLKFSFPLKSKTPKTLYCGLVTKVLSYQKILISVYVFEYSFSRILLNCNRKTEEQTGLMLSATAHMSEDSQEKKPHEKGVVNVALPVELRAPGHKEITMGSKQRGLQ